ncbi:hypothetical protein ALC53_01734 [Atta colombica]|uniref:Uncharacterized protein n=1 Tax=Atta colombica TaxID=520822 RepID=A0A195BUT1_9HYME|nr:hypothetical protein ALC53_01734 [Atta colombica]
MRAEKEVQEDDEGEGEEEEEGEDEGQRAAPALLSVSSYFQTRAPLSLFIPWLLLLSTLYVLARSDGFKLIDSPTKN